MWCWCSWYARLFQDKSARIKSTQHYGERRYQSSLAAGENDNRTLLDGGSKVEQFYKERRKEEMIRAKLTKGRLKLQVQEINPLPMGFDQITLAMLDPDFVAPSTDEHERGR